MNQNEQSDFISQVEEELTWRLNELRFLKNQLSLIENDEDKKKFRKSLVVMLYSYYEGFCKSAFQIYIQAINSQNLSRNDVSLPLRVSSMNKIFNAYESGKKDQRFQRDLPNDNELHKYSRQMTFVEEFSNFLSETVLIPEDLVDTESNLKPIVLRKILYRLGFPVDQVQNSEGTINQLLNYRNDISHGSRKEGIQEQSYEHLETKVKKLMDTIRSVINNAISESSYLEIAE